MNLQKLVYVCSAGHVEVKPTHGVFLSCQHPVAIEGRWAGRGYSPCGAQLFEAPDPDGALEAAFRVGGAQAAIAVISERAREGAHPAVSR